MSAQFQTVPAHQLKPGDEVIHPEADYPFEVVTAPVKTAEWLFNAQVKVMGLANGQGGWMYYDKSAPVKIVARAEELVAA